MNFRGRQIDPISFWSNYVEFPPRTSEDGSEFSPLVLCPNPEHDNFRSPAFQVNMRHPMVHCFSRCGIEGSYEHAICVIEGLYEKHQVTKAPNIREQKIRMRKARNEAKKIIIRNSNTSRVSRQPNEKRPVAKAKQRNKVAYETYVPQAGIEYLAKRGITGDEISFWSMGWDSGEGRIVIPVNDENGNLKFLVKRGIKDSQQPKYLYTEGVEKSSVLFGADTITPSPGGIVLVEGVFDVIKLAKYGLPAVAILGTGISKRQVAVIGKLRPKTVFLMFDKDSAGVRNIEIAYENLKGYPLHVCRFPRGKSDPAELTENEAERSIRGAVPILIWRKRVQERIKRG